MVCSLNTKQREVFDYVRDWAHRKLRLLNSGSRELGKRNCR